MLPKIQTLIHIIELSLSGIGNRALNDYPHDQSDFVYCKITLFITKILAFFL